MPQGSNGKSDCRSCLPLVYSSNTHNKENNGKKIAMQETMTTKWPLFSFSSRRGQHEGRIHAFQLQEGFHFHSCLRSYWRFVLANVKCKTRRMCVSRIPNKCMVTSSCDN